MRCGACGREVPFTDTVHVKMFGLGFERAVWAVCPSCAGYLRWCIETKLAPVHFDIRDMSEESDEELWARIGMQSKE